VAQPCHHAERLIGTSGGTPRLGSPHICQILKNATSGIMSCCTSATSKVWMTLKDYGVSCILAQMKPTQVTIMTENNGFVNNRISNRDKGF
jgi:hypothetical protein